MPDVNLTPYDVRAAQIAQQQKMAQLIAQQSQQPIEVGSYKGIQAPISPLSGINKVLQAALSAYQMKKGATDLGNLNKDEREAYLKAIGADTPAPAASAAPDFSAGAPSVPDASQFEIAPGQGQKLAAILQGQAPPQAAPPVAAPIAAPQGPDPTAGPDPTQGLPQGNGPAIASALQGPSPQATPPAPAPMPTLPRQGPQIGPAPDVTMGPQAAPPPQAPAPDATPPDPMQARLAAAQANLQKARATAAQFAGTPYATPANAAVTAAQEQVKKIGDLQDAATAKEAERVAQTNRTIHFIADVPGLDDNTRKVLTLGAAADPDTAKVVTAAMVKDAFTHKLVQATPQDLQGYPQGTIAQKDPVSGKLENIYNPVPNLMAIANEKLHAQEVGLSGARLSLERQRFAFDKDQKTNAVFDPATLSQMAKQALAGDTSVFTNLGRGAQGAQNVVALRREMYLQGQQAGMTPAQIASKNAAFFGEKAEARAAGTRVGATDVATAEVPGLAQEALARHAALAARGSIVPFNKAVQMVQSNTSSPELAQAVAANQAVINAYARSFGTGVTSDHARQEASQVLQTAWGTKAYTAAVQQIVRNTQIERHGAKAALDAIGSGQAAPMPSAPGRVIRYDAHGNRIP